mgnify:CR=1 FL=1
MARVRNDYFTYMEEQAVASCEASKLLKEIIENYSEAKLPQLKVKMHEIEHRADKMEHDIIVKLSAEFITPIDQEDILKLVQVNEDITDIIDEVVQELYMYHIEYAPKGAAELAKLVDECVNALKEAVASLRNFKKPDTIRPLLDKVSEIEEEADEAYAEAVHNLFMTETEPRVLIGHKEIYGSLEACCDLCDRAADIMDQIIIKNT